MVVTKDMLLVYPFATLPLLYSLQHCFKSEFTAQIFTILAQLIVMVLLPFAVAIMRVGETSDGLADNLQLLCWVLPSCPLA